MDRAGSPRRRSLQTGPSAIGRAIIHRHGNESVLFRHSPTPLRRGLLARTPAGASSASTASGLLVRLKDPPRRGRPKPTSSRAGFARATLENDQRLTCAGNPPPGPEETSSAGTERPLGFHHGFRSAIGPADRRDHGDLAGHQGVKRAEERPAIRCALTNPHRVAAPVHLQEGTRTDAYVYVKASLRPARFAPGKASRKTDQIATRRRWPRNTAGTITGS
jgi:hypothetical protein